MIQMLLSQEGLSKIASPFHLITISFIVFIIRNHLDYFCILPLSDVKLQESRDFCPLCHLLYSQLLEQ